ncbi:MAG TPA: Hachiman antiphage defense system protein HamA [Phenylobacterium sp.]
MFDDWCDEGVEEAGRKRLWRFTEKPGGRVGVRDELCQRLRDHYRSAERIADDVEALGYPGAAAILQELLPRTATARSGDLGEALASEVIEEKSSFRVPIRRLRYKDSREMALRGDDFIGLWVDAEGHLHLLKGESKSRAGLAEAVVIEARAALSRDDGRPTPSSLLFVSDRLLEAGGADEQLGRALRDEVAQRAVPPTRIDHVLFTLSGNPAVEALRTDLVNADALRTHTSINLRVVDHQAFIADIYAGAAELGDD